MRLPLSQGLFTVVDDDAPGPIVMSKWCAGRVGGGLVYAVRSRTSSTPKMIRLHRALMELKLGRTLLSGELVDHVNGDTLDNRLSNLRLTTHRGNCQNKSRQSNNKSGFKGVRYDPRTNKWLTDIATATGTKLYLGEFDDIHLAAITYDMAAIRHHGEFARTNYPLSAYPTRESDAK